MNDMIYHLTTEEVWAAVDGDYMPPEYWADGFIHGSYYQQLKQVADFIFSLQDKLLVLEIDPSLVKSEIKVENTTGGTEKFPHIYGALPQAAVMRTFTVEKGEDGGYVIPPLQSVL